MNFPLVFTRLLWNKQSVISGQLLKKKELVKSIKRGIILSQSLIKETRRKMSDKPKIIFVLGAPGNLSDYS